MHAPVHRHDGWGRRTVLERIPKRVFYPVAAVVAAALVVTIAFLLSDRGSTPAATAKGSHSTSTASSTGSSTGSTATAPSGTKGSSAPAPTDQAALRRTTLCSLTPQKVTALATPPGGGKVSFENMRDAVDELEQQIDGLSLVLPDSPAARVLTGHLRGIEAAWRDAIAATDAKKPAAARQAAARATHIIAALPQDLAALKVAC